MNNETRVSPFPTTRQSIVKSPREKTISPPKINNRKSAIIREKSPVIFRN
jgi:hypothetical protein